MRNVEQHLTTLHATVRRKWSLTVTFDFFLVQFFSFSFFDSFMSYFSVWGQLCREKNIKLTKKTSFMSFSFIYLIFVLNETHFCIILTRTYAAFVNICYKRESLMSLVVAALMDAVSGFPIPTKNYVTVF